VFTSASAHAQVTATGSVDVTANVGAAARLTLSAGAISFANSNPDTVPSIPASAVINVSARARTAAAGNVTLTVLADQPLTSGSDTIPDAAVTWTATGAGYAAGTMSSTVAQTLGSFTGPSNNNGTQSYALANSWTYVPGTYTMTVTYTLSAP